MGAKNSQRLPQKRNFGALAWSHLYKQTNIHAGLGATGTTGKSFRVVSCMRAEGVYNSGQQALGSWSPFSFSAPGGFPFSPPPASNIHPASSDFIGWPDAHHMQERLLSYIYNVYCDLHVGGTCRNIYFWNFLHGDVERLQLLVVMQ